MKLMRMVSMVLALSLTTAGVAYGQGDRNRDDRNRNDRGRGDGRDYNDNSRGDQRGRPDMRRDDRRGDGDGWRGRGRGAGPDHRFYRGNRLPPEWRHNRYVINDWRGHRLNAPPRGYHWVQTGADYVLVAIATGLILQILLTQ
jgi:Ni/Co efflux regulator RcnB